MKARFLAIAALALAACGGTPPPDAAVPATPATPTAAVPEAAPEDPWAIDGELAAETLPAEPPSFAAEPIKLPQPPRELARPPASCAAFAAGGPAGACNDRAAALASLDEALAETEPNKRNRALRGLERCEHLPAGMVVALRAELAPVECADTIVRAAVASPPAGIDGVTYHALVGLGLAGMLSRASTDPPKLAPPYPKDKVKEFIDTKVKQWVTDQAVAIQELSKVGAGLKYYGQAVVAVEAGMADMRFVEVVRDLPIPDEFQNDDELKQTYLNALEQSFEARKRRGRDAALVGLGRLATVGVIRDERVDRARALLSTMYGGSPIDALDEIILPPLSPVTPEGAEQRLASRLPTFYASLVFPADAATDATMLRMLINKGLSLPHRIALSKAQASEKQATANQAAAKQASDERRRLLARARFELGQNYWRAVDFDEALRALGSAEGLTPQGKLLFALGLALQGGPANAAEMMVKAPVRELGIGDVAALDALAEEGGDLAGPAAFDAAYIAELAAPKSADAAYWRAIAERYRQAAERLVDLPLKKDAEQRATEAERVAEEIASRR